MFFGYRGFEVVRIWRVCRVFRAYGGCRVSWAF